MSTCIKPNVVLLFNSKNNSIGCIGIKESVNEVSCKNKMLPIMTESGELDNINYIDDIHSIFEEENEISAVESLLCNMITTDYSLYPNDSIITKEFPSFNDAKILSKIGCIKKIYYYSKNDSKDSNDSFNLLMKSGKSFNYIGDEF